MLRNIRLAARAILRTPGFALTAVLTLALGVGACTAMYSILYAVVLQPLPFGQPDRLVAITGKPAAPLSLPTIDDWASRTGAFSSIAAYTSWGPRVESNAGTGRASTILVSQNFLSTLRLGLAQGRDFTRTGNEQDCLHQAIVSQAYAQRLGGARTLLLDRQTYSVIGVLPASAAIEGTDALNEPDILTPLGCDPKKKPADRDDSPFLAVGRLRDGVSLRSADAALQAAQRSLAHDFPNTYAPGFAPAIVPLAEALEGNNTRASVITAMAACGTLLLIACANLTNLLLARNARRRSELALRATLGATPGHLLRQMLAENSLLVALGSACGVLLAATSLHGLRSISALHLPRLSQATLSLPALGFAAAVSVAIASVLTILPARRSLRPGLLADLGTGRTNSPSAGLRRTGRVLVALQIALAMVLVSLAGWMVSSVLILLHQPLGFDPDHLVVASTDLRGPTPEPVTNPEKVLATLSASLDRLRAIPGVLAVAASNDRPLGGRTNQYTFCADVHPSDCREARQNPDVFLTTPSYFRTVGQTLQRGRDFNPADDGRNHVAIVNHALAQQQWPGQDPIGHRIFSDYLHQWAVVVGEVGDVHSYSLERAPTPDLYLPEADLPDPRVYFLLQTSGDPALLSETVRAVLHNNPQVDLRFVTTMLETMAHQVALRRFFMDAAAGFGAAALALAILGTWGLLSYEVSLREREIGLRLALGSTREAIVHVLLWQESRWILAGCTAGLVAAAAAGFLLRAEFYGTRASSAPVLGSAAFLLIVASLAAVAIPARAASQLDPAITLRRD